MLFPRWCALLDEVDGKPPSGGRAGLPMFTLARKPKTKKSYTEDKICILCLRGFHEILIKLAHRQRYDGAEILVFTARCPIVKSAVLRLHVVCPSVWL